MKYVSLDIETTGLTKTTCNILEIGCIIEDTDTKLERELCPSIHLLIKNDILIGEPIAIAANSNIIKEIVSLSKTGLDSRLTSPSDIAGRIKEFLLKNGVEKPIFAGKNVGSFDIPFLDIHASGFSSIPRSYRFIDVGSVMIDFKNDKDIPNLAECKQRVGINEFVSHKALDDAWDVIKVLRTKY